MWMILLRICMDDFVRELKSMHSCSALSQNLPKLVISTSLNFFDGES